MSATIYPFTPEMIAELQQLYPTTQNDVLAAHFGCNYRRIVNLRNKYGFKKDSEWVREMARIRSVDPNYGGRKSRFKKGMTPANKGKKQTDFMSAEAIENSSATRFKKGQAVWNRKPVGYERLSKDGYVVVKTAEPNVFEAKHRVVWQAHHGKIPKGYNVQFRDGNRLNCDDISNLYLIGRADQLKNENSIYARYPEELQLAIRAKGALSRQINKFKNQE